MMDTPHTGFHDQTRSLLYIETELFDVEVVGKPYHPNIEALQLHRDEKGRFAEAIIVVKPYSLLLKSTNVYVFSPEENKLVDWNGGKVFPCFYETQSYHLVIQRRKVEHSVAFYHDNINLRNAIRPLRNKNILTGTLNFQNEVGYTDLEIHIDGELGLAIQLEIFPTKLDYRKDYYAILEDVNRQVYNLSFDFLKQTYQLSGLKESGQQSMTEFFTILQNIFQQLLQAVERIRYAPQYHLQKDSHLMDAARVKKAGRENIGLLSKKPHLLIRDEKCSLLRDGSIGYRPTRLIETRRRIEYDTSENRFLRWVLERIDRKLKHLKDWLFRRGDEKQDPVLLERISRMKNHIRRLLQMDFLHQSGSMKYLSITLVLQMAPGYREVYRVYLMLMKGLSIQNDLLHISMKNLATLYEYWCFMKIHELLSNKYKLVKQDIIRVDRSGLYVTLDKTTQAVVTYENPQNGEQFTLHYNSLPVEERNKKFPTLGQQPDNILTLRKHDAGRSQVYKYVFDAKYRINPAYVGTSYYNAYHAPGPQEDDINTMHRYRDAIVYQEDPSHEFERSMFGAYVLFPYGDEESYKEHRFYKSIELVNIGAFPFLPHATGLMEKFLDELIMDSPEKAFERSTRPKGTAGYYMNKFTGKNVLIGSMRDSLQLSEALNGLFYHMPLENLEDHKVLTQLEYIALCQNASKYPNEGGIRWIGEIEDWRICKRGQIEERPSVAGTENELYVYFKIRKWGKLPELIGLGGHEGVYKCLYASKYIVDRAREVAELRLDSDEQIREWRELRRKGGVMIILDHKYVDLAKQVFGVGKIEG
jgi:predicted component of viral defense system (DUF524 family)